MMIVFGEIRRNAHEAARFYAARFPGRNHADHKVILGAQETGQVVPDRRYLRGYQRDVCTTVKNEAAAVHVYEKGRSRSIRKVFRIVEISKSTAHRIVNENRLHPFY